MRLLELATGPDELVDLHPNVTVVTGLDADGRRRLFAAVDGLARGEASGARGLLEAHGVLFDLTPEMVGLLEVAVDDLRPVVASVDLPGRVDPTARARAEAERGRSEAEARWAAAEQVDEQARRAMEAAVQARQRAREAAAPAEAGTAGRSGSVDALTAELAHAVEQRRQLADARAELEPRVTEATTARADLEAAATELREARRQAAERRALVAAQVEQASSSLDPDASRRASEATATLAEVEREVAAERDAERRAERERADEPVVEPPAARLVRVQGEIDELEKQPVAFGPVELQRVQDELARAAAIDRDEMVPSPRARALADALAALDAQLATAPDVRGRPEDLVEARDRLDDARQALLEAEQSVRNPELDRALADRLEVVHADLVEAIEKADGRFGAARAQRRVEAGRAAEQAVLDELGFMSYSDYMMGHSLRHVDREKEAALEAARSDLAIAEEAWTTLQEMTDAELVRAELLERRRLLVEEARRQLPGPVPAGSLIDELHELGVRVTIAPSATDGLREALEAVGVGLGDEALDHDDLLLIGKAWVDEAAGAVEREAQVRQDLEGLREERDHAQADLRAGESLAALPDPGAPEAARMARLAEATRVARQAEERRRACEEAERTLRSLTDELAAAADAERLAADAATGAAEAVAGAVGHADGLLDELRRLDQQLTQARHDESASEERLRSLANADGAPPIEVSSAAAAQAEAVATSAEAAAERAARALRAAEVQRQEATSAWEALSGDTGVIEEDLSAVDEIEWYLLARLAAQRSVSLAGSLPLVLDDALGGLADDDLGHVLGRLERMSEAVQVIVVSDDPRSRAWVQLAGPDRAAVVSPQPI